MSEPQLLSTDDRLALLESQINALSEKITHQSEGIALILGTMRQINEHIAPAMAAVQNGGLMSLLMGRKSKG